MDLILPSMGPMRKWFIPIIGRKKDCIGVDYIQDVSTEEIIFVEDQNLGGSSKTEQDKSLDYMLNIGCSDSDGTVCSRDEGSAIASDDNYDNIHEESSEEFSTSDEESERFSQYLRAFNGSARKIQNLIHSGNSFCDSSDDMITMYHLRGDNIWEKFEKTMDDLSQIRGKILEETRTSNKC